MAVLSAGDYFSALASRFSAAAGLGRGAMTEGLPSILFSRMYWSISFQPAKMADLLALGFRRVAVLRAAQGMAACAADGLGSSSRWAMRGPAPCRECRPSVASGQQQGQGGGKSAKTHVQGSSGFWPPLSAAAPGFEGCGHAGQKLGPKGLGAGRRAVIRVRHP